MCQSSKERYKKSLFFLCIFYHLRLSLFSKPFVSIFSYSYLHVIPLSSFCSFVSHILIFFFYSSSYFSPLIPYPSLTPLTLFPYISFPPFLTLSPSYPPFPPPCRFSSLYTPPGKRQPRHRISSRRFTNSQRQSLKERLMRLLGIHW